MPVGIGVPIEPSYFSENSKKLDEQDFPALPRSKPTCVILKVDPLISSVNSNITEVIEIPSDERRSLNIDDGLSGKKYQSQRKVFMNIARDNGVEININTSKSNILTVAITGEPVNVARAKRSLTAELQTQVRLIIE